MEHQCSFNDLKLLSWVVANVTGLDWHVDQYFETFYLEFSVLWRSFLVMFTFVSYLAQLFFNKFD